MFRRSRRREPVPAPPPTPPAVGHRWEPFVEGARASRRRFDDLVVIVPAGPLRDRLEQLASHLANGIQRCWAAAADADRLEQALQALDPAAVTAAHKEAKRRLTEGTVSSEAEATSARLLAEQHARVQGMLNVLDGAEERLRLVQLRLDGVVVRAAELVARHTGESGADALDRDLEELGEELDALRAGLQAVS